MSKKEIKELKEKNLSFSYELEAAEDEITNLKEQLTEKHRKLWEVIQENDRLTMKYEPYRPPGDEHEDREFYELIEENKKLQDKIDSMSNSIGYLAEDKKRLQASLFELQQKLKNMKPKKVRKNGVISLDFWPPRDWFRFSYHKWNPGMSAQLCVGPVRIDWFAD